MARYWVVLILGCAVSFLFLVSPGITDQASHSSPKNELKQPGFVLPQKHKTNLTRAEQRGKALFEYYCALCHGKTGEADGFNSYNLTTPPAKLADAKRMSGVSDAQIKQIIKDGGPALGLSPQMPSWGRVLTDQQVSELTAFIRTLAKRDGETAQKTVK